jgi:hypothetical protein
MLVFYELLNLNYYLNITLAVGWQGLYVLTDNFNSSLLSLWFFTTSSSNMEFK